MLSPRRGPSRAALAALALLIAACAAPRARDTGAAPIPAEPAVEPRLETGRFRYAAGTFVYDVTGEATIAVRGDTSAPETLRTDARVTYRIAEGYPPRPLSGRVDRYEVRGGRAATAPAAAGGGAEDATSALLAPVPFHGTLGPGGVRLELAPADTTVPCDSAGGAEAPALALARELLVAPPDSLVVGTTWTDTTATTLCRGGVPVTTTAVQRYEVVGTARFQGREAVAIRRTSELAIAGQGSQRSRTIVVTGTGSGRGTLYADADRGALLGGDAEFVAELTVESGTRRQQFVQRATRRVRLR